MLNGKASSTWNNGQNVHLDELALGPTSLSSPCKPGLHLAKLAALRANGVSPDDLRRMSAAEVNQAWLKMLARKSSKTAKPNSNAA
jgi:hypothetical protein